MNIIIYIALAAIVFVVHLMRKLSADDTMPQEQGPHQAMPEAFPTIEILPRPAEEPVPKPAARVQKPRPETHKPVAQGLQETAAPAPKQQTEKPSGRYAIKSKSDAKRAIIYHEIFNRKYN